MKLFILLAYMFVVPTACAEPLFFRGVLESLKFEPEPMFITEGRKIPPGHGCGTVEAKLNIVQTNSTRLIQTPRTITQSLGEWCHTTWTWQVRDYLVIMPEVESEEPRHVLQIPRSSEYAITTHELGEGKLKTVPLPERLPYFPIISSQIKYAPDFFLESEIFEVEDGQIYAIRGIDLQSLFSKPTK